MSIRVPIFVSRARRFHARSSFSTEHIRGTGKVRVRLSVFGELGGFFWWDLLTREQRAVFGRREPVTVLILLVRIVDINFLRGRHIELETLVRSKRIRPGRRDGIDGLAVEPVWGRSS